MDLVHELARTRPQLLIGTVGFERAFDRAYTRGTNAWLWERPESAHTHAWGAVIRSCCKSTGFGKRSACLGC